MISRKIEYYRIYPISTLCTIKFSRNQNFGILKHFTHLSVLFKVSLALLTGAGLGAFSVFSLSDELDEPDVAPDSDPEDELEAELLDTEDEVAEVALVAGFLDLFDFTMELPENTKYSRYLNTFDNFGELSREIHSHR